VSLMMCMYGHLILELTIATAQCLGGSLGRGQSRVWRAIAAQSKSISNRTQMFKDTERLQINLRP